MTLAICIVLQLFILALVLRIVLSWFPLGDGFLASAYRALFQVTEPVLGPLRGLLPPVRIGDFGLDLGPIVLIFVLTLVIRVICP
ncbi:MAG: YggT family protein [Acidimicrobiales bacterium]|nr:YggT family protein [Acidimicrobiales bacterium]